MDEHRVVVRPPDESGGRRVQVGGKTLGTAHCLHDLMGLLEQAGLEPLDEVAVAEHPRIEWHGGGPEVWKP
ncbi:hypothetical protein [Streptomyces olivochromogenes]|uniref:hypothetical protein n=1 Tax=Streptomyces olivochromogenes TaxID=1963 RepID=UPI001F2B02B4|nr:hypothetical protein [Streptomyces olivochromogenes]MCF3134160.1 hypothetical protein [Streptomyces olivochromogenes]